MRKICPFTAPLFIAFCLLPLLTQQASAKAVISEVLWAGSDLSTSDEWLEIAGLDDVTSLSGWTLTSVNTSGNEVMLLKFSTGASIQPGEFLVISRYVAAQSRLASEPAFTTSDMSLPNSKLLLRLRDAAGQVVDQADDGSGSPFAGENITSPIKKASMERISLLAAGSDSANWATATESRGLDDSSPVFGTPGFPRTAAVPSSSSSSFSSTSSVSSSPSTPSLSLSLSSPTIVTPTEDRSASFVDRWLLIATTPADRAAFVLSGVMPNPSGKDQGREWVEIHNVTTREQSLEGWSVIPVGGKGGAVTLGDIVLQPGQSRQFVSSQLRLTLPNQEGEVRLLSPVGTVVSRIHWKTAQDDAVFFAQDRPVRGITATVVQVIDGDTIDVEVPASAAASGLRRSERVRLIGIDAPEIHAPDPRSASLAKRALVFLRDLVRGGDVTLEFDGEMRDAYGRLLAYVVTSGGASAQVALLEEGLASVEQRFTFSRLEQFLSVQREAQSDGLGLWSFGASEKVVKVEKVIQVEEVSEVFSVSSSSAWSMSSKSSSKKSRASSSRSSKKSVRKAATPKKSVTSRAKKAVQKSSAPAEIPDDDGAGVAMLQSYTPLNPVSDLPPEFQAIEELVESPSLVASFSAPSEIVDSPSSLPSPLLSMIVSGAASVSGILGWVIGKMRT